MKAEELTDVCISEPESQIVIELQNGQKLATKSYRHAVNKKGEPIIIVIVGRNIEK